MEDWLKQVKEDWNKTSDSEWYKSLRTDEKIEELTRQSSESLHSINDWESNPMHYRHGSQSFRKSSISFHLDLINHLCVDLREPDFLRLS